MYFSFAFVLRDPPPQLPTTGTAIATAAGATTGTTPDHKKKKRSRNSNVNRKSNSRFAATSIVPWSEEKIVKVIRIIMSIKTFWNCVVRFSPFLTSTGLNSCLNPRHSMTQVTNRVAELKGSPYKTREVILG